MPTTQQQTQTGLTWEQVCRDPNLQDLPYKIETNERGQIVMSPVNVNHGFFQSRILQLLGTLLPEGQTGVECAVRTSGGTKAADVGWFSTERASEVKGRVEAHVAPEICVEVLSLSNTTAEIDEKKTLYFEAGAEEVWTCDRDGRMRFFDASGELEASKRAPGFPQTVEI